MEDTLQNIRAQYANSRAKFNRVVDDSPVYSSQRSYNPPPPQPMFVPPQPQQQPVYERPSPHLQSMEIEYLKQTLAAKENEIQSLTRELATLRKYTNVLEDSIMTLKYGNGPPQNEEPTRIQFKREDDTAKLLNLSL